MVRQNFKENLIGMNKDFRFRGKDQTRLETFSDAVFALAITMLVISQEVPKHYDELVVLTADLIPFAMCIALITYIWFEHFMFFIMFGFRNAYVVFLNTVLLFLVLFYVYPLKFLAQLLTKVYGNLFLKITGAEVSFGNVNDMIHHSNMSSLMVIYGLGASLIFLMLVLLYKYALSKKSELELTEIEYYDAKSRYYLLMVMGGVPFLSVLISIIWSGHLVAGIISGFTYFLYPILTGVLSYKRDKRRKVLKKKLGI